MPTPTAFRGVPVVLSILVTFLCASPPSSAQNLIFADILNAADPAGNSIRSVGVNGAGLHTLIATGGGVRGVDVDPAPASSTGPTSTTSSSAAPTWMAAASRP